MGSTTRKIMIYLGLICSDLILHLKYPLSSVSHGIGPYPKFKSHQSKSAFILLIDVIYISSCDYHICKKDLWIINLMKYINNKLCIY